MNLNFFLEVLEKRTALLESGYILISHPLPQIFFANLKTSLTQLLNRGLFSERFIQYKFSPRKRYHTLGEWQMGEDKPPQALSSLAGSVFLYLYFLPQQPLAM